MIPRGAVPAGGGSVYLTARGRDTRAPDRPTVPTPEGGDFNDDLAALGPQALASRLALLPGTGP